MWLKRAHGILTFSQIFSPNICSNYSEIFESIYLNIGGLCTGIESSLFEGSGSDRTCNYSVNVFVSTLVQKSWDVRDCEVCHFSIELTRCSGSALFALWALWSSRINGTLGTEGLTHKSLRVWLCCRVASIVQRGHFGPWAMTSGNLVIGFLLYDQHHDCTACGFLEHYFISNQ